MNRIILIGNGFDLAHGLKTSYKDFINWYWYDSVKNLQEVNRGLIYQHSNTKLWNASDGYFTVFIIISSDTNISELISDFFKSDFSTVSVYEQFDKLVTKNKGEIKFHNKFLERISKHLLLKNWVDIEGEYNKVLHEIIEKQKNNETRGFAPKPDSESKESYDIERLNEEFRIITKALKKYLHEEVANNKCQPCRGILEKIYSDFIPQDFIEKGSMNLYEEYKDQSHYFPKEILFLSFNYTDTEEYYVNQECNPKIETEVIHIHGELRYESNPIIFGYGDEIHDEYKTIEEMNDNHYLENIKSIRYLETDDYKRLLDFINSDAYQIFMALPLNRVDAHEGFDQASE